MSLLALAGFDNAAAVWWPPPHGSDSAVVERLEPRRLLSSVAGLWAGSRTEAGLTGTFANVTITLALTQSRNRVTGTEQRTSPGDAEYFADLLTHGTIAGNTFSLQDGLITASKAPSNYTWLLYTSTLQLSRDGQTLSGPWHSGRLHGTITLQRVPVPRITLNAAAATPGGKGINLEYTISTTPVAQPLRFDVYRSRTPHLNAGAQLVGSQTLTPAAHADRLTVGSHRVTLLATTGVSADTRRPYVIVVASPNGAALEAADSINVIEFSP